jgi:hypothetical protein
MLNLLDESLETFLRAEVPLSAKAVDLSFEAPDSDWGAGVTKPTVNLYLWDVRRNVEGAQSGFELVEDEDGNKTRQAPKPRVDCRYLVTAWTSEIQDEHALLGQLLATLLTHDFLPEQHLVERYRKVRPLPTLSVASADGKDQSDFWSALGGQLKPGLDLLVTATVDAGVLWEVGPPVDRFGLGIHDTTSEERVSHALFVGGHREAPAGTVVRSPRGSTRLGDDGDFLIRADPGDEVVVDADTPAKAKVPKTGSVAPK